MGGHFSRTMSSAQPVVTSLHDFDNQTISKTLNILNETEYQVFPKLPSTYTIKIKPTQVSLSLLEQVKMCNQRMIKVQIDLNNGELEIKSWKYGKEKAKKKSKRKRQQHYEEEVDFKGYNLEKIHVWDLVSVKSIISTLVKNTKLGFDLKIKDESQKYIVTVDLKEPFDLSLLEKINTKVGSFIDKIVLLFQAKKMEIHVNRNDCTDGKNKKRKL